MCVCVCVCGLQVVWLLVRWSRESLNGQINECSLIPPPPPLFIFDLRIRDCNRTQYARLHGRYAPQHHGIELRKMKARVAAEFVARVVPRLAQVSARVSVNVRSFVRARCR